MYVVFFLFAYVWILFDILMRHCKYVILPLMLVLLSPCTRRPTSFPKDAFQVSLRVGLESLIFCCIMLLFPLYLGGLDFFYQYLPCNPHSSRAIPHFVCDKNCDLLTYHVWRGKWYHVWVWYCWWVFIYCPWISSRWDLSLVFFSRNWDCDHWSNIYCLPLVCFGH